MTMAPADFNWRRSRAKLAALSRSRSADDPDLNDARRDLKAARLAEYISETVESAPPLSLEQRDRLALLLRSSEAAGGPDAAA